ncbi:glycosyltransferase family 4 protein [Anaerobacillus sp. MEB173]|uniref:glycosyltransferase family 4 protein n=1 Tax=Anaerobacillus sp. MEB173 TaxID=3383345 RepID=UPI003F93F247
MKIAFICTESLPSPAIKGGAIQMMIDGVSPYLSKKYELTIFSITDPQLPDYESKENLTYIRVPKEDFVAQVCSHIKRHDFDIIHVFNRPNNIPEYKAHAPHSRFILGVHNEMFSEEKISYELGSDVIDQVDHIVTISNYIKETITYRFPTSKSKIKVVYSGIDLNDYPEIASDEYKRIRYMYREKYKLHNKKVILFVGRLSKSKGPHLLIQAMKDVLLIHQDAALVIAGGKWFSDNTVNSYVRTLYRLAKPFKEKIIFTKFIPASEIPNIFIMSDLFVCSSQWQEPLARVHYEAMAASLPVITTNRGGNAEVILHEFNGYLLNNYNQPKEYTKAIDYLFENPQLSKWMAGNGRTFVEINFQFKHVAGRLEDTYLSVLK